MQSKVWVLAPDKPSGEAFASVLERMGIEIMVDYPVITPRVIGDKINPDPAVAWDLQTALRKAIDSGYNKIVIACNTLQFWLSQVHIPQGLEIYTTFASAELAYPDIKSRPLWIGTTVAVERIKNFPTLISLGKPELQKMSQEIIWRTKAVTGADTKTAGEIEKINDPELLTKLAERFLEELKKIGVESIIMGCTEYPIVFEKYVSEASKIGLTLIDPAELVGKALLRNERNGRLV